MRILTNYIKTAFRNMLRNKVYTIINILGLSIGLAVFMLIFFYVKFERNYDKHFHQAEQIYRLNTDMIWPNGEVQMTAVSTPAAAPVIEANYPEVLAASRFVVEFEPLLTINGKEGIYEEEVFYVDSSFFKVWNSQAWLKTKPGLNAIEGSLQNANTIPGLTTFMKDPRAMAMDRSTALLHFGDEDPIGKIVKLNNDMQYTVRMVYDDLPANSQFDFSLLINGESHPDFESDNWRSMSAYTYLMLEEGTDVKALENKLREFKDSYLEPWKEIMDFNLEAMLDIHLYSIRSFEYAKKSDPNTLLALSAIAILILLIACINYMNLATARSLNRAREVGLRKVLGADRKKIIVQFISESILLAFISFFTAIVLTELCLPAFANIFEVEVQPNYLIEIPFLLLIVFIVGLLSGSYPAFYISAFSPINVLKGRFSGSKKGMLLRKVLVVSQFAITISLIAGTFVINKQMRYIRDKDLGFDKDHIVNLYIWNDESGRTAEFMAQEMAKHPGIHKITICDHLPGRAPWFDHFWPENSDSHMPMRTASVDEHYLNTFDIQLISGRNFDPAHKTDTGAIIINEAAANHFGWSKEEALGKKVKWNFSNSWDETIESPIIGVVADYHYQSLHQKVEPIILTHYQQNKYMVSLKVMGKDIPAVLDYAQKKYLESNYAFPFEYTFLEQDMKEMYERDQKLSQVVLYFSVLSILIACLGLLGLSSFAVDKRAREIGVRKVFGADIISILRLFTREFSYLILIGWLISGPISWYLMDLWLSNFAYHTHISWWIVLLSGIIAFTIGVLTINTQAWRHARQNPIKALAYE